MNQVDLAAMRARLYLDQDVSVRVAGMLQKVQVDVLTTAEAGRLGHPDDDQLAFSVSLGRAIVTHNRVDFEALHLRYFELQKRHCGIIVAVVRRDKSRTRDLILDLLNRFDSDQFHNRLLYA